LSYALIKEEPEVPSAQPALTPSTIGKRKEPEPFTLDNKPSKNGRIECNISEAKTRSTEVLLSESKNGVRKKLTPEQRKRISRGMKKMFAEKRRMQGIPKSLQKFARVKERGQTPQILRLSKQAYVYAKLLRGAVKASIMAKGGEIGELELYASMLVKELLDK
jgi:hypothetical protein